MKDGVGFESPALEEEFRADLAERSRRPTRVTLVLVIVVYALWGVGDWKLYPQHLETILAIRLAVIAVLATALALTYRPLYVRARSYIVGAGAAVAAGGLIAMTLISPGEMAPYFYTGIYTGLGITIFGTCTLFLLRFKAALRITLLILVAYAVSSALGGVPEVSLLMGSFYLGTAAILGPLAAYTIERYARRSFLALRALEAERARSERLLLNVLPAPVAERLKRGEAPIADHYPEASVLFADIADFTELSSAMSPEDLVRLLNEVFTEFDHVAAKHGLEKIKTIGDAYMAVAGVRWRGLITSRRLPTPRSTCAR